LAHAKKHLNDGRVTYSLCDVTSLPLPCHDATVDVAFSVFLFNEIPALKHTTRELARVLKYDATFYVVTTHPFVPLNYYLYETFTGRPNGKITPVKGYFDNYSATYQFTIANMTAPFFHHTLGALVNSFLDAGLHLRMLHELTVTADLIEGVPSYAGCDDIPRYLVIEGSKPADRP
jgi:ubiquinone/menaquinone biosynthesis C-methylase UbiE